MAEPPEPQNTPNRMGRVLVTGGSGFLGSWVVDSLLSTGAAVRVFDKHISRNVLNAVTPGNAVKIEAISGDISDPDAVNLAAEGCDAIIHLAGLLTTTCRNAPLLSAQVNLIGGINMFEAARNHGISRIAYVSSAGVFGPDDGTTPLPTTLYGTHKLAMEGFARSYFADHGLAATGFRPYIVYGPGEGSGISAGPSTACRAALQGQRFEIKFTGRAGFVHVQDVANAFTAAIEAPRGTADIFNLCGETASVAGFIAILSRLVPGANISCAGPPMPIAPELASTPLPSWLARLPVTGLEQGIAETLRHLHSARRGTA